LPYLDEVRSLAGAPFDVLEQRVDLSGGQVLEDPLDLEQEAIVKAEELGVLSLRPELPFVEVGRGP
jgi:hypothetical protein